jgi:hypothetical protein
MSQNKDVIFKLRKIMELRRKTIMANKKAMKSYLVEYQKSLVLEKELKIEQQVIRSAINLLQYGDSPPQDELTEEISLNNASNRDSNIVSSDEE